ncbi:hypothetical protein WBG78_19200 [Chryseolinea sp. T2]|uniref:hypothetical protein n=1 Tax=Chryseolinea sp. T2 TaxID=3129255 RepID=UPI003077D05A
MSQTLGERDHDFKQQSVTLPDELKELVDSGIAEEQGCVLVKDFQYSEPGQLDSDLRRTEYEEFINAIHISDYISEPSEEFEYLKVGLELGKQIYNRLTQQYSSDFRVTVSFSETVYAGHEIDTYGDCVVKFHKVRPSCEDKFKMDNLEEFETEGVLVIE